MGHSVLHQDVPLKQGSGLGSRFALIAPRLVSYTGCKHTIVCGIQTPEGENRDGAV